MTVIVSGLFGIFFSAAIARSDGESATAAVAPTNANTKKPKNNDRAKLLIFPSIWRFI